MPSLNLRHIKGFNGSLRGSARAHPRIPGQIFYVSGAQIVAASEDIFAPQTLLRGHDDRITAFAMSNSGTLMASGQCGKNADVLIWDTASLAVRSRFQEHDMEVVQVVFSPDDRLLLTVGHEKDQKVFVLDTSNGKIIAKGMTEFNKRVTAAAFAPITNPKIYNFATASDNEITLWTLDPFSGLLSSLKVDAGSVRRTYTSLVYAPDGQWLYAGTASGDVVSVNVIRGTVQMTHPACANGVGCMSLSTAGKLLVAGGDGTITLFSNDHMWREIRPFVSVQGSISSISSNCDGSALLVATVQGSLFRISVSTLAVNVVEQGHRAMSIQGMSFAPGDSECVATCSDDGSVSVWSLRDYSQVNRVAEPAAGSALCVALGQDIIVSGWADGLLRCHGRSRGTPSAWFIPGAHQSTVATGVTAVRLANRAQFAVSGGAAGEIRVWDMRTRGMVSNMKQHSGAITDITVLSDDAHLVASSEDRKWSIWDIHQAKSRASWCVSTMIKGHAVAPDQVTVVTVGTDRRVQFWDIRAPESTRTLNAAHAGEIGCVAVDPRGMTFATGGADAIIKVWDLRSGTPLMQADVHTAPVAKVAYSPAGTQLVSVGADGAVAVMDLVL